jgi:hypothetical protein
VPTEYGLYYSVNHIKLIKGFYSLYLGKTGHAASEWLGGRSVPTDDKLFLSFNMYFLVFSNKRRMLYIHAL